ncbi:MAG: nucleotidyltransferase domain-containing protein [Acidobacteria bacterium]|nr:nucleotidyltransferase domain-containing protein [Acidobacteriota bacterium]
MNAPDARDNPILHALVRGLAGAVGPRLKSVVLYGSAARGDFVRKASDLNLIIVVESLDPATLEGLAPLLKRFLRRGHPVPRLFSPALIAASADTFPIEFLEIGSSRAVLYGEDPFAGLAIRRDCLRLQCERELKEKMMRLREGYVLCHDRPRALRRLLTSSYPAFAALFRGGLHLLGREIPPGSDDVVAAFCEAAGLDGAPFEDVARLRRGESGAGDPKAIFERYYDQLTRAARHVDRLETGGGTP